MKMGKIKVYATVLPLLLTCGVLFAQSPSGVRAGESRLAASDSVVLHIPEASSPVVSPVRIMDRWEQLTDTQKLAAADSLHEAYQFRRAIELCDGILTQSSDSLIKLYASELLRQSESGFDLSASVSFPTVIARQKFTLKDFFLYYPFADRSWHRTPSCAGLRDSLQNVLSPKALGILPDITYFQDEDDAIYFSSPDSTGQMKIFSSSLDTLWSRPRQVFPTDTLSFAADSVTVGDSSSLVKDIPLSDEIFPVLSADRRSLYFSARRPDSAGGYDLYESVWSEADSKWGEPVNLGFPYSSVGNDYLYMNTDDGRYTVFASDRGCTKDSVWVYVLEYEFAPQQQRITDAERLRRIMELVPSDGTDVVDAGSAVEGGIPENSDTKRYMEKMEIVRQLRDMLDRTNRSLEQMREEFALSDDVERRQELTSAILEKESKVPQIQTELDKAAAEVQKIEMEFLLGGVVIDYNALSSEASRKIVGESSRYVFKERKMGEGLKLDFVKETPSVEVLPTE